MVPLYRVFRSMCLSVKDWFLAFRKGDANNTERGLSFKINQIHNVYKILILTFTKILFLQFKKYIQTNLFFIYPVNKFLAGIGILFLYILERLIPLRPLDQNIFALVIFHVFLPFIYFRILMHLSHETVKKNCVWSSNDELTKKIKIFLCKLEKQNAFQHQNVNQGENWKHIGKHLTTLAP